MNVSFSRQQARPLFGAIVQIVVASSLHGRASLLTSCSDLLLIGRERGWVDKVEKGERKKERMIIVLTLVKSDSAKDEQLDLLD